MMKEWKMARKKDEGVDTSRRFFMTRATAVTGGVAAAAVAATGAGKAVAKSADAMVDHSARYREDDRRQGELMAAKKFVEMSSAETEQMLEVILRHHRDVS